MLEQSSDPSPAGAWVVILVVIALLIIGSVALVGLRRRTEERQRRWGLTEIGGLTYLAFAVAAVLSWLYAESWPLVISLVVTGFVVTSYGLIILAVRQYWVINPSDQLSSVISELSAPADQAHPSTLPAEPHLAWSTPGYPIEQYYERRRRWDRAITTATTADELRAVAGAALTIASSTTALDTSRGILQKQAVQPSPSALLVRHHARLVVAQAIDQGMAKVNLVQKVQNHLTVFAFLLLGVVVAFSTHGWAAPMLMGAAAACLFRVRQSLPDRSSSLGGGARWMAMLLTPLIGAVAAVIGLVVVNALEGKVFTEGLVGQLDLPSWNVHAGQHVFSTSALAVAIAFGWSAKLLDTLLTRLTDEVESTTAPTASAGPTPDPDPPPATALETEELPARRAGQMQVSARAALTELVAERARAQACLRLLMADPDFKGQLPSPDPLEPLVREYLDITPSADPKPSEVFSATAAAAFIEEIATALKGKKSAEVRRRMLGASTQLRTAAAAADQAYLLQEESAALTASAVTTAAPETGTAPPSDPPVGGDQHHLGGV